jgi:hypothetical protein
MEKPTDALVVFHAYNRMAQPTDVRLLEIIQSARNVSIRRNRVWNINDPEIRTAVKNYVPHISTDWFETRIQEFKMMVQAHKVILSCRRKESATHIIIQNLF